MERTYEDYVLEVFANARVLDNEQEHTYANKFWISDGHGNDISADCDSEYDAWKSAYDKMFKHINKMDGFKNFM